MSEAKECFLIDDDPDDQELFLMALERIDKNINCHMANNGIDALKRLRKVNGFVPDYIFLDINMPKMSGMECLVELKKLDHLDQSEILMFSTSSDLKIIAASKALGANHFFVKPPSMDLLVETLAKMLRR
ncbi:MAG TPA: response regulator [Flavitalea sp.]|nr:response regulator [Flavitalea sp.]